MNLTLAAVFVIAALFDWLERREYPRVVYESPEPVRGWWCRGPEMVQ